MAANTYLVQEIPPAGFTAPGTNPATIVITAAEATNGVVAGNIDSFSTPETVTASTTGPTSDAISVSAPEALGQNRDLIAQIVSGPGDISLTSNSFGQDVLEFDSSATGAGDRTVAWDGPNGLTPSVLNPTGLDHADLTVPVNNNPTATGISLTLGGDHAGGSITLNVYTDANDWSTATNIPIPDTGGQATQTVFVPYSSFTTGSGAAGPADFTDVGAVQMQIIGGVEAANGQISLVQEVGPTPFVTNFANIAQANLSITKVDNAGGSSITPSTGNVTPGQTLVYTVVVSNTGTGGATGVVVADPLPGTFTGDSWTATATGGATGFSPSGTGNIDDSNVTLPASSTITYVITGTVSPTATGTLSNTASVTPPGAGPLTATDTDNLANLSISKVDNAGGSSITPSTGHVIPGQTLVYTVVVSNTGTGNVTGAAVTDPLPGNFTGDSWTASETGGANGFSPTGAGNIDDTSVNLPAGSTITYVITGTVKRDGHGHAVEHRHSCADRRHRQDRDRHGQSGEPGDHQGRHRRWFKHHTQHRQRHPGPDACLHGRGQQHGHGQRDGGRRDRPAAWQLHGR